MLACLRAREAWQEAGCPGAVAEQLVLFPLAGIRPEVEKAERLDRPRKRKR